MACYGGGGGGFQRIPFDTKEFWDVFNEAKKNIRSLLLSSKTGASTVEILNDYTTFINKPLHKTKSSIASIVIEMDK